MKEATRRLACQTQGWGTASSTYGNFKDRVCLLSFEGIGKEKIIPDTNFHLPTETTGLGTHFSSRVRAVTGFTRRYLQVG